MSQWPHKPYIYEINTAVWLTTLSASYNKPTTLENVPDEVVDGLAALNVDAVWLMGVWHRSEAVRASALNYLHEYVHALPDVTPDDVLGSAYAIGDYTVSDRLGGRTGLARFRRQLQDRGLRLILDFVPNHVAVDHPWVSQHPDYFVRGGFKDLRTQPDTFFKTKDAWGRTLIVGHGRDPYYPGWIDTAQLDAFSAAYRRAATDTLLDIADQCDGVRCDMAMLAVNHIFAHTWGSWVDDPPEEEFWEAVIPAVKAQHPDFLFAAEVYWGMEHQLQTLGFDFTYDKIFYDRIADGDITRLREHLRAEQAFQDRTIRFLENHDEPRAASILDKARGRAAAVLLCTLPGGVLLHDGQFTGRKVKLPVQIARQPDEAQDHDLEAFYHRLLRETRAPVYQSGTWRLFDVDPAWEGNHTHEQLLAHGWNNGDYCLIVVNMSSEWAQGIVNLRAWNGFSKHDWRLTDMLQDTYYYRRGSEMAGDGLFIELAPNTAHIFRFERLATQPSEFDLMPEAGHH